jgi:hypothetical protein
MIPALPDRSRMRRHPFTDLGIIFLLNRERVSITIAEDIAGLFIRDMALKD